MRTVLKNRKYLSRNKKYGDLLLYCGLLGLVFLCFKSLLLLRADDFSFDFENANQLARSEVLFICHKHWLGIRSATVALGYPVALVQDETLDLNCLSVIRLFRRYRFRTLAISGIPPHSISCATLLRHFVPGIRIVLSFHGSFAQHAAQASESQALQAAVNATREGIVDCVGFLKRGMATYFRAANICTIELGNVLEPLQLRIGKLHDVDGRLHIGLFTSGDSWVKNFHNQLAAACILDGVVIHTTIIPHDSRALFSSCVAVIVEHGWLPHHVVPQFLGMMDINMYASLTECFPMVVLQSLAAGVPCIVSNTSAVYTTSRMFSSKLVVDAHEDVDALNRVLSDALRSLSSLEKECYSLLRSSNIRWGRVWNKFLGVKEPLTLDVPPLLGSSVAHESLPHAPSSFQKAITICFITEELGRIMPGGMGTLLDGTLRALSIDPRFRLMVLADVKSSDTRKWHALLRADGLDVKVFRVAELVNKKLLQDGDAFVARTHYFHAALLEAYKRMPFDVVEGYDYFGPMAKVVSDGKLSSVRKIVRLHGTFQIIDIAQDISLGGMRSKSTSYLRMNLLEQYAMLKADALVANSEGSAEVYRKLYPDLKNQFIATVAPPMQQILGPAADCSYRPTLDSQTYLIYGKQQEVKGTYTIVRAAVQFLQLNKFGGNHMEFRFRFVGHNALTDCSQRRCLWSLIPKQFQDRFEFVESVPKFALCGILEDVRSAIFASVSETFCLAAHEIFALGVPLIISDLDAIRPFFNRSNALTFNPFDVNSLADQLQLSTADEFIALRKQARKLFYSSVPSAYIALFEQMPTTQSEELIRAAYAVNAIVERMV